MAVDKNRGKPARKETTQPRRHILTEGNLDHMQQVRDMFRPGFFAASSMTSSTQARTAEHPHRSF